MLVGVDFGGSQQGVLGIVVFDKAVHDKECVLLVFPLVQEFGLTLDLVVEVVEENEERKKQNQCAETQVE